MNIFVIDAINCLKIAVDLYTDDGRFTIAAKHQKEIAELYEQEMDFENSIESYQTAADYYEGEGSTRYLIFILCFFFN